MKQPTKFTIHIYQLAVLILLNGVLLLGLSHIAMSQVVKPKPAPQVKPTPPAAKKTIVIKSRGIGLPQAERSAEVKRLKSVGLAEATSRLKTVMAEHGDSNTAAITTYATLSPRTPFVENKAFLQVFNAKALKPGNNFFDFSITYDYADKVLNTGIVEAWIKPSRAGQWLMVDCTVWNRSGTFEIKQSEQNVSNVTFTGEGHLEFFINAEDANWHRISISRVMPSNFGNLTDYTYRELSEKFQWHFYSCEIAATK